jgi:hypothetical protein
LQQMDQVDNLPDLQRVGKALGERVSLDHFGSFAA